MLSKNKKISQGNTFLFPRSKIRAYLYIPNGLCWAMATNHDGWGKGVGENSMANCRKKHIVSSFNSLKPLEQFENHALMI